MLVDVISPLFANHKAENSQALKYSRLRFRSKGVKIRPVQYGSPSHLWNIYLYYFAHDIILQKKQIEFHKKLKLIRHPEQNMLPRIYILET